MLQFDHKITLNPAVVMTELENKEAVLLNLEQKTYYTLNTTGLRIWQMLEEGLTPTQISERIPEEFDASPQHAKESVVRHIQQLVNENLAMI